MDWVLLDDTNVRAVAWEAGALYVQFQAKRNGRHRVYAYPGVDQGVFLELKYTEDPNQYHHDHIKGVYPWVEMFDVDGP